MAHCLSAHPGVVLPAGKEAHVFDAPDFDDDATTAEVDARYAPHFSTEPVEALYGDATPIYCLHECFIERIARYNPDMKWILLLRHPVDRAISHYFMERARGDESWALWPALLLEPWRLRGRDNDFAIGSPLRHFSYRLRGEYARQLDIVHQYFDPSRVLVLRSSDFLLDPARELRKVYDHLGLTGPVVLPEQTQAFRGNYDRLSRRSLTWRLADLLLERQRRDLRKRYGITLD